MSLSRRRLLRVAGTGAAVGLAGCSGSGKTPAPGVQAEASVNSGLARDGTPVLVVTWVVNRDARYLTVEVENTTTGESVSTALCGLGAGVRYNGASGSASPTSRGAPVGNPPNCNKGSPSGLAFGPGDDLSVTVTAHLAGDETEEILSRTVAIPTPTPTPTSSGNSSASG